MAFARIRPRITQTIRCASVWIVAQISSAAQVEALPSGPIAHTPPRAAQSNCSSRQFAGLQPVRAFWGETLRSDLITPRYFLCRENILPTAVRAFVDDGLAAVLEIA